MPINPLVWRNRFNGTVENRSQIEQYFGLKDTESWRHNLVFGNRVTIPGRAWVNLDSRFLSAGCIISGWEIDGCAQATYQGAIIDPSKYSLVLSDRNYLPVVSYLDLQPKGLIETGQLWEEFVRDLRMTVSGIKHYAYDSTGNALISSALNAQGGVTPETSGIYDGMACSHKMTADTFAGSSPVTNPIWVSIFILLNEFGLKPEMIDWEAAYDVATWCENPTWSDASFNSGYDLNINIDKEYTIKECLALTLPLSCHYRISRGMLQFGRVYESTNSRHVTHMHFDDSDIIERSFSIGKVDPYAQVNSFTFKYSVPVGPDVDTSSNANGKWNQGRYDLALNSATFDIQQNQDDYINKKSTGVSLTQWYDTDNFENGDGSNMIALEALLFWRREIYGSYVFRFAVNKFAAMCLEYRDFITFSHDSAESESYASQPATIEDVKPEHETGVVWITARVHSDSWFLKDPNAILNNPLSTIPTSPGDFPTYRYKLNANWSSGPTIVLKSETTGAIFDPRTLQPGNAIWVARTTISSEANYADFYKWSFVGLIDSVVDNGSTATITLDRTPSSSDTSTQDNVTALLLSGVKIQIQPSSRAAETYKFGSSGSWLILYQLTKPAWNFLGNSTVEFNSVGTDFSESSTEWESWPGSMEADNEGFYGSGLLSLAYNYYGYFVARNYTTTLLLPLTLRFSNINNLGNISDSQPFFYSFPYVIEVNKSLRGTIQTPIVFDTSGSSFNELDFVFLQTNFSPQTATSHRSIHRFRIKIKSTTFGGDFNAAGSTLIYDGPPFKSMSIRMTAAAYLALKFNDDIFLAIQATNNNGDVLEYSGSPFTDFMTLNRQPKLWTLFTGTLNTYNSGGNNLAGSGMLNCGSDFSDFVPSWNNIGDIGGTAEAYAGGSYWYSPHRPAQSASLEVWKRASFESGAYVLNGPTSAIESNGDVKLGHIVYSEPNSNHAQQQGLLFYALTTEANQAVYKGEYLFGVGKSFNRSFYYTTTFKSAGSGVSAHYFLNTSNNLHGNGNWPGYREASLVIKRCALTSDFLNGPHKVLINGLVANGMLLTSNPNPSGGNLGISPNLDNYYSRFLMIASGVEFGNVVYQNQPYLISVGKIPSASAPEIHTYPFIAGATGALIIENPDGENNTTQGVAVSYHHLKCFVRMGPTGFRFTTTFGENYGDVVYRGIAVSPSPNFNMMPVGTSHPFTGSDTQLRGAHRFDHTTNKLYIWNGSAWVSVTLT